MFDLNDKTALVTGASGGIGGAIAGALAEQGAQLVLTGRRREALDSLASQLPGTARVLVADLSSSEGIAALVSEVGPLDILVNNAGLTRDNLALRMKAEEWQSVLDVNLTATFRLIQAVLKGMMKQRYGRIINITSIVGVTGNPGQANYAASKAGMIGMTKSLAAEVASRGITLNCVAPGFIKTAMTDALSDSQQEALRSAIPMQRMGSVKEIAAAVAFLASEEAAYVSGQTLHVNGGMAMI
jgi:3-oxoacyl-[acyl-carrier protein] reductase